MWWLLLLLPIALIVLFAVVLIRACRFKPKAQPDTDGEEITFDRDASISALAALIRCKTVSYRDHSLEDDAEFEKLIGLLPSLYPEVHRTCDFTRLPDRGLLFRWKGKRDTDPAVMMAHYDVVPANEELWA